MKYYLQATMFLFLSTGIACTQDDSLNVQIPKSKSTNILALNKAKGKDVSMEDLSQISTNFWAQQNEVGLQTKVALATKTVKEIHPILNEEGTDTTAFVINYTNNNGFLIVSGTRDYYPILAYSEEGNFDVNKEGCPLGVEIVLAEYERGMKNEIHTDSTNYALYWNALEPHDIRNVEQLKAISTRAGDDYFQYMESCIAEWREQGYTVYFIDQNPGLPSDTYQQWYQLAKDKTKENGHIFSQSAFILERTTSESVMRGPLLTTEWHQDYPYNQKLDKIDGEYPKAGCVAIAMAQIMKYHRWPSNYNWSAMSNRETANTNWTYAATLIRDIGIAAKIDYGTDASGGDADDAKNAFTSSKFNYSSAIKLVDHKSSTPIADLEANRPVYMRGYRNKVLFWGKNGHAWVCDGLSTVSSQSFYRLVVMPSPYDNYYFEDEASYHKNNGSAVNLHMNWGWNTETTNYNGWYYNDLANPGSYNYQYSRQDMINIYPNK